MIWGTIGFLAGLFGIIIPLAIHLFGKRRKVIQPWGAMRFLQEAKPTWKKRTLRLQDLLVLLCRMAAIALLAFAFARPALKVPVPAQNGDSVTILIDRSASTELGEIKGDRVFDEIVKRTEEVLDELPEQTNLYLFVNGSGMELQALPPETGRHLNEKRNQTAWIKTLKNLEPGDSSLEWTQAIRTAFDNNDSPSRRIVVIGDAAQTGWPETGDWKGLAEEIKPARIRLFAVGPQHPHREIPNVCVDRIETDQERVQSGKPVSLTATIANRGTAPSSPLTLKWTSGPERDLIEKSSLPELLPGEIRQVMFRRTFPEAGARAIRLEIETAKDALPFDNTASRVIEVIDRVPVAVVIDVPPDQLDDAGERFAYWAFAAAAGAPESIAFGDHPAPKIDIKINDPFFRLTWMTPKDFLEQDMNNYAAIVWSVADSSELENRRLAEKLRSFVARGGGLWLRPPFDVDTHSFNQVFFPHEFGISPAGLSPNRPRSPEAIGLRPLEKAAPAFASLTGLRAKSHLNLSAPFPRSTRVLAEFEGGDPFVLRRSLGTGEVILSALDSDRRFGNLAASVGYVPYIRETLWRLGSSHFPKRNFAPGDRDFPGDPNEAGGLSWLESPDGSLTPVSLSRRPEESETAAVTQSYLDQLHRSEGLEVHGFDNEILHGSNAASTGENKSPPTNFETREIWAWLLMGLIGFLIFEVILAHHLMSRRRSTMMPKN